MSGVRARHGQLSNTHPSEYFAVTAEDCLGNPEPIDTRRNPIFFYNSDKHVFKPFELFICVILGVLDMSSYGILFYK